MRLTASNFFYCALPLMAVAFWAFQPVSYGQTVDPSRLEIIRQEQEAQKARDAELSANRAAVLQDIQTLKTDLIRLAAEAEGYEKSGREIEARLTQLHNQQTRLKTVIYGDRKALQRMLGAMQRVQANPPPAFAVVPADAADAMRAGKLMGGISRALNRRAEDLTQQLDQLAQLRQTIEAEQKQLAANEASLTRKTASIESLVKRKSQLEQSISLEQSAVQKRVHDLAQEADSLQELIRQLENSARHILPRLKPDPNRIFDNDIETVRPRMKPSYRSAPAPLILPPDTQRFADAREYVRAPVRGRIEKSYNRQHTGLTISTRRAAQVVAPYTGRVEFAGPFKNYDSVVILNAGEGYFILLTGLGDLYVQSGQMVETGEPMGLMSKESPKDAKLYLEVRKDGTPVNPAPWFGTVFSG